MSLGFLIVINCLISSLGRAEIILINNDGSPINIKTATSQEVQQLSDIYYNIIYRYQWPTVIQHISNMESKERSEYLLNAFSTQHKTKTINNFINDKVRKFSDGKYKTVQISTTLFELCAINAVQILYPTENEFNDLPFDIPADFLLRSSSRFVPL